MKPTKGNDLYLTLTERKKTFVDGRKPYQKHKTFLYKEVKKFEDSLKNVLIKVKELTSSGEYKIVEKAEEDSVSEISFEDL